MADLWAHNSSYAIGFIGSMIVVASYRVRLAAAIAMLLFRPDLLGRALD